MILNQQSLICCIDFETTGNLRDNLPVEFAFARFYPDGRLVDHWETEIAVKRADTKASSRFEEVMQVKSLRECWTTIDEKLSGQIICGHNVGVDKQLLLKEFPFFKAHSYIDTLSLYRQLYDKQIDDYSLESLLHIFNLYDPIMAHPLNGHFYPHRALFDAVGSAHLLMRLYQDPRTKSLFEEQDQGMLF